MPRVSLIDEQGVVVKDGARVEDAEAFFTEERAGGLHPGRAFGDFLAAHANLAELHRRTELEGEERHVFMGTSAMNHLVANGARVMRGEPPARSDLDFAVTFLGEFVQRFPDDPLGHWRLGVALRTRHDSAFRQPGDFAGAIEHWRAALDMDPAQYIWRRRIQQYGPRLDKPYPFYDWVDEARAEITARGETPVPLPVPLTGTERLGPSREEIVTGAAVDPDPRGLVPRAEEDWLFVNAVVVPDTQGRAGVSRLHVDLWPNDETRVHWNNEADPVEIWIGAPDLPEGVTVTERSLRGDLPSEPVSFETRHFDLELRTDDIAPGTVLGGYALFYACEDVDGQCVYLRRDFEVVLPG